MAFLDGQDTISGGEGSAVIDIDGRVEHLFNLKSLESKVELDKEEIDIMGHGGTPTKVKKWKGTGSMTMYHMTSTWSRMMVNFIKTRRLPSIRLVITNHDEASTVGRQTIVLEKVKVDGALLAKLEAGAVLEEDVSFTFEGADILEEFVAPQAR